MSEKIPKARIDPKTGERLRLVKSADKYVEVASENMERELSSEEIEMVMGKVQDINANGTAYSVIGADSKHTNSIYQLQNVLRVGLIGSGGEPKIWARETRKRKFSSVFFNIVGRSPDSDRISDSYWWQHRDRAIGVVFETSSFNETLHHHDQGDRKIRTFWADHRGSPLGDDAAQKMWDEKLGGLHPGDPRILEHPEFENLKEKGALDDQGRPRSETDYGFQLFSRVAPRNFQGLVIAKGLGGVKSYGGHGQSFDYPEPVVKMMLEENVLLPIYDDGGNLLWPKQMRYEDVKKLGRKG